MPGTYFVIEYGPSEMVCWRQSALSGTYWSYSIGRADENGIARMFGKSGAGWMRWKTSVVAFGALTPETA